MKAPEFKSRSIFATFLLIAICTVSAVKAQQNAEENLKNTTPEERAQFLTEILKEKLGLSAEQEKEVSAINLKYAIKMNPVIKGNDSKLQKLKTAKAINKEKEAAFKPVFTAAQYEKYLQLKEELKDAMIERMKEKRKASQ